MTTTVTPISAVRRAATDWLAQTGSVPAAELAATVADLTIRAAAAATALRTVGVVHADLAPNNGYVYRLTAALIPDAAGWPGSLLIAIPEFHRSLLLDANGAFHFPSYIEEKIGLGADHAAFLAAYTSLLSEALRRRDTT